MGVNAKAIHLIRRLLTFKNIAFYMPKFPLATSFVIFSHSLIAGSIWPILDAIAMLLVFKPLSVVHSSVFKYSFVPQFHFGVNSTRQIVQAKLVKQIRILVHAFIMIYYLVGVEKTFPANHSPKPGFQ
jgi:hypothetical protein